MAALGPKADMRLRGSECPKRTFGALRVRGEPIPCERQRLQGRETRPAVCRILL